MRCLFIINERESGDGGALSSSFSHHIRRDADPNNRVNGGDVVAHELLHFWDGLLPVPADHQEAWSKESATNFLTSMAVARNGWIGKPLLLERLENVPRRHVRRAWIPRADSLELPRVVRWIRRHWHGMRKST